MKKKNWAILISGWGRSAIKTLELYKEGRLGNHDIKLIIYEKKENGVLDLAADLEVECLHIPKSDFPNINDYYNVLFRQFEVHNVDYIFLQGYKHIVREPLLSKYRDRIVNIHPSLLPAFRGKKAIQQAMNYGVKITGMTTHLIDEDVDRGKILCQRCIRIHENESFEAIDSRYLVEGKKIIEDTFLTLS